MNSQTIFYPKRHNITMSQKSKIKLSRKEKNDKSPKMLEDLELKWAILS